jgi:hypothetical protein
MKQSTKNTWMFAIKVFVIVFIAIHVYGTQARLLYRINPETTEAIRMGGFHFFVWNEYTIIAQIFGLVYGVITAGIIFLYSEHDKNIKILTISTFALLDGIGMLVYYSSDINNLFIIFAAFYYFIYTVAIILAAGLHKSSSGAKEDNEPQIDRNLIIMKLDEQGFKGFEISDITGISKATVSRILRSQTKDREK